jgi:hypothetical protein
LGLSASLAGGTRLMLSQWEQTMCFGGSFIASSQLPPSRTGSTSRALTTINLPNFRGASPQQPRPDTDTVPHQGGLPGRVRMVEALTIAQPRKILPAASNSKRMLP